ncbi:MAG TPA: hydrogenase formation protein HypD [Bacteroidales bacterium]|nr:hydrogenase formation protein HypD [Bacteroidales bacterium]
MRFAGQLRSKDIATSIIERICEINDGNYVLMEVCGSHTMAIHRFGIPSMLPSSIRLISGPGCPVCVTSSGFIENAVTLARNPGNIITTFGDLLRVPGKSMTLERCRGNGSDIRVVKSPLEALEIAAVNKRKKVIFLGIGFETTTPSAAITIQEADARKVDNFFLLSAHKVMQPALRALVTDGIKFEGLIAPGHVSAITGSSIYMFLAEDFNLACVISGFEPVDILLSIYMLIKQINDGKPRVEIQYSRAVKPEGNSQARAAIEQVFMQVDDWWRGLGVIRNSGLALREEYKSFDARDHFELAPEENNEPAGCLCGSIMKGLKSPPECPYFGKECRPQDPVGACMVSQEGACQAFYRYNRKHDQIRTGK